MRPRCCPCCSPAAQTGTPTCGSALCMDWGAPHSTGEASPRAGGWARGGVRWGGLNGPSGAVIVQLPSANCPLTSSCRMRPSRAPGFIFVCTSAASLPHPPARPPACLPARCAGVRASGPTLRLLWPPSWRWSAPPTRAQRTTSSASTTPCRVGGRVGGLFGVNWVGEANRLCNACWERDPDSQPCFADATLATAVHLCLPACSWAPPPHLPGFLIACLQRWARCWSSSQTCWTRPRAACGCSSCRSRGTRSRPRRCTSSCWASSSAQTRGGWVGGWVGGCSRRSVGRPCPDGKCLVRGSWFRADWSRKGALPSRNCP